MNSDMKYVFREELYYWTIFGEKCNMTLKKDVDILLYESFSDVGEIRVYQRADFQSGSRVLKKVF